MRKSESGLSMNRAGCGSQTRGPDRASVRRSGSWSQCATEKSWGLPMNLVAADVRRLSLKSEIRNPKSEIARASYSENGIGRKCSPSPGPSPPYLFSPLDVAQVSKPAVSRVSNPQTLGRLQSLGTGDGSADWKSAIQQVWKPALRPKG